MGNPAGVKRDFDALEERRLRAHTLIKRGLTDAEVAREVGVHRQSVGRWRKQIAEQGRAGLKKAGRAGRKSRLSESDLSKIERRLKQGPQALGYETGLWTLARIAELLEKNAASSTTRAISGGCWARWGGAANDRPHGRLNAMRF